MDNLTFTSWSQWKSHTSRCKLLSYTCPITTTKITKPSVKRVRTLLSGSEKGSHMVSALLAVCAQIWERLCQGDISPRSVSSLTSFRFSFSSWVLRCVDSVMSTDRQIGSFLNCWWHVRYEKWVSNLPWTVALRNWQSYVYNGNIANEYSNCSWH